MTRSDSDIASVAWITNLAAPYRRPLWEELSRHARLTVYLTDSRRSHDATGRGDDWFDDHFASYKVEHLRTLNLRIGRHSGTLALGDPNRALGSADAVLLGGWQTPVYWQLLRDAKRRGLRTVGFYESTLHSQEYSGGVVGAMRRKFFSSLDAVVTPGLAATEAVRDMAVPAERIFTGFNAVDVEAINREARIARRHQDPTPPTSGHRFVYVGQFIARKNVHGLLHAFERVAAPEDHLTLIGDGPLSADLRELSTRLGIADRTAFVGAVPYRTLPHRLAHEHTLVLPATTEVWGLVVNEALAAGLQAVVSSACGVCASVHHMEGVQVCSPDEGGIADSMLAARRSWRAWQDEPEILQHTPERFSRVFEAALQVKRRSGRAHDQ